MESNLSPDSADSSLSSSDSPPPSSAEPSPSDPWEAFFADPSYPTDLGEPVDTPVTLRLRQRQQEKLSRLFANTTWAQLGRLYPLCSKTDTYVWLHLRPLQAIKGKDAWVWADLGVLTSWGIPRRTYQQALRNLAEAGLVELDAQPGRKTRVRLKPV